MNCPSCGDANPEGMKFCGKCGKVLANVCSTCKFENPLEFRFCGRCGTALSAVSGSSPAPAAAPAPSHPASFAGGRYQVKKFLGEGGKKRVYLAYDTILDREVAFALIKTQGLDEAARQRITREARAMGRLGDHPHIMPIYDLGQEADQPFMVLPLMSGGDVEGLVKKAPERRIPLERAALSYLGLGDRAPAAEWGAMLNDGRPYFRSQPWLMALPGLCICLVALAANLLGDLLRDLLDPRSR